MTNSDATRTMPCGACVANDAGLSTGDIVAGYRIIDLIGEGGMGRVFLAEHTRLGRRVALKALRPTVAEEPQVLARFFAESRAVNAIGHPNIVDVTDVIELPRQGIYATVMELLEGQDLRLLLEREGSLPVRRAVHVGRQVADALVSSHAAGVVHRDLKPANVFVLERQGDPDFVKLLDFGVAKLLAAAWPEDSMLTTMPGVIMGTPTHLAPEQVSGGKVDDRADVYGLGTLLFEMLTGRPPFVGRTAEEVLLQHLSSSPPRPSELEERKSVPEALETLILQCLAKDPDDRPQCMEEVSRRLAEIEDEELLALGPPRPRSREGYPLARGATALAATLLLFGSALFGVLPASGTGPAAAQNALVSPSDRAEDLETGVMVLFDSVPTGAKVYEEGSDEPLGVTPFAEVYEPGSPPRVVEFRLAGRAPVSREVSLRRDLHLVVSLGRGGLGGPEAVPALKTPEASRAGACVGAPEDCPAPAEALPECRATRGAPVPQPAAEARFGQAGLKGEVISLELGP